jgi:YVTN family beta-propeller protein
MGAKSGGPARWFVAGIRIRTVSVVIAGLAAAAVAACSTRTSVVSPAAHTGGARPGQRAPARPAAHPPAGAARGALAAPGDVYAYIRPGMVNPKWRADPLRVYVPNSQSNTVTVIDPQTYKVIGEFPVGGQPNHVTPSWDGSVLWVNDTDGFDLTPVNPATGQPGKPVPVADPYNLYFTPDGRSAMVMAEALGRIDFRDPHTMKLQHSLPVPCSGLNHLDFTADGRYAVASCEFSAQLVRIDVAQRKVTGTIMLGAASDMDGVPGASMPQDVRLSPDGKTFYVADMMRNGVWVIDAATFREAGFIPTGAGTHGFLISRDSTDLFASNRGEGSVSVISFATRKVVHKWWIPGGGSPDMGGITPDGNVMWWGGRYNGVAYAMSTQNGRILAEIPVGAGPHGLCVFPQPGRYSLGHTGNFR